MAREGNGCSLCGGCDGRRESRKKCKNVKCTFAGGSGALAAASAGEPQCCWHCVLVKCICHSLSLCGKDAFDELPSNLPFLLSEMKVG